MRKASWILLLAWVLMGVGCAGVGIVPEKNRSAHFEKTMKHLDLGGTVFLYMDVDGDMEKLSEIVDEVLKEAASLEPGNGLEKVDAKKLVGLLGLNAVKTIGLSSYRSGDIYHNKAILLHQGSRQGLMKSFGGPARSFETPGWAPADADLVFESDMDLEAIYQVIESMLKDVMGDQADQILAELDQPVEGLRVTYRKLISSLNTRLVGVVRIDEKQILHLPGEEIDFPHTELAIGMDGLGFVFDDLVEAIGGNPMVAVNKDGPWTVLEPKSPLPGELSIYKPLLAKENATGRLYVASSRKFLDELTAKKAPLVRSKAYKQATRGLPLKGNRLAYVSGGFVVKLTDWLDRLAKKDEELTIIMRVVHSLLPDKDIPVAAVTANLPDGIYFSSNTSDSHKTTLMAMAYANPMVIGMLAAVAIPAFIGYQRAAPEAYEMPAEAPAMPGTPPMAPQAVPAPEPVPKK